MLAFISRDKWTIAVFFIGLMCAGQFGRGEISPFPWYAFCQQYARHGFWDGTVTFLSVLIVDVWLLWIPAQAFVMGNPDLDNRTIWLAYLLNLAVGLLLLTPHNPVYSLVDWFGSLPRDRDWD